MIDMRQRYPEEEGVPSLLLLNMMRRWEKEQCHVDGFVILRNGKLVSEAFRSPYTRKSRRLVHSVSKTITSIGIGIAVDEGLLSVRDRVLSFFPQYVPEEKSAGWLSRLTIKHLLTMSVGHEGDSIDVAYCEGEPAWKAFLDLEIKIHPGERFSYNSAATYMLSKILTVKTGKKLLDYLRPRLFEPLGITDLIWDEIDEANTGGWGCQIALEDMAKLGQLLLQKGIWDGKRILSETWIEEMSSRQIGTDAQIYDDWRQGYGYQMWRCNRTDCYRADGAFGQYILVLPPKNMVVAIWSEDAYSQDMLNIFWEEVYDQIDERIYGVDGSAWAAYQVLCREWSALKRYEPSASYLELQVDGQSYAAQNGSGSVVDAISLSFAQEGHLTAVFEKEGQKSVILAGNTEDCTGETEQTFEVASFIRWRGLREYPTAYAAHYRWLSERMLQIQINWLCTAHSTDITCMFHQDSITVEFTPSYEKFMVGTESSPALLISSQRFYGNRKV